MNKVLTESVLTDLSIPLDISEVEFRIQSINNGGYARILAYKDARVDMNRLDKVCGPFWQDKYKVIENSLYCSIGIKIGEEWIWREDVGSESNQDAEKGRASDAFKRAGFRWGIGRELYNYPVIEVPLFPEEWVKSKDPRVEKNKSTYNLRLKHWAWFLILGKENTIERLTAVDEEGRTRFDSKRKKQRLEHKPKKTPEKSHDQVVKIQDRDPSVLPPPPPDDQKKWLDVMDPKTKNLTPEWVNVIKGISSGLINSVADVRKYYKVNRREAQKIKELIEK